jgi:hypothetical protein
MDIRTSARLIATSRHVRPLVFVVFHFFRIVGECATSESLSNLKFPDTTNTLLKSKTAETYKPRKVEESGPPLTNLPGLRKGKLVELWLLAKPAWFQQVATAITLFRAWN